MPDPFVTQIVLDKPEHRARIADAVTSLQMVLDELDRIGPMLASAHLSLAIETLKTTLADPDESNPD